MNNVVIISNLQFEKRQGAAFSRLLNYSKALKECAALFLTTYEKGISVKSINKLRITDNFFSITTNKKRPRTKIYRLLLRHLDFIGSYKYLKCIYQLFKLEGNNIDSVLFYGTDLALAINSLIYFRLIKRINICIEKSELEIGIVINQYIPVNLKGFLAILIFPVQFICSLLLDSIVPLFSGIIVISRRMEKLYSKFSKNVIRVPILTDIRSATALSDFQKNGLLLIGFTGVISQKKEGIFEFVKTLGALTEEIKGLIRMNIYGEGICEEVNILKKKIINYNLTNVIFFHKTVSSEDIPEILCKHDLLILTRPSNIQTEYGFSTKLAEYLASGVPVLASRVSDNSYYLNDMKNALLVGPQDLDSISSKIIFCLSNRAIIKEIGIAGRKTSEQHFYYGLYSKKLIHFLSKPS